VFLGVILGLQERSCSVGVKVLMGFKNLGGFALFKSVIDDYFSTTISQQASYPQGFIKYIDS